MVRMLKAFAWMRWRMLVNSLEHTGSRDVLERFSIAIEKLGPIIAGVLFIPSAVALLGLGIAAGYAVGSGDPRTILLQVARYLLMLVPLLAVVGPLLLPAADRTNPVRLLLLPIPRSTLYVAQSSAAFGDIWNLLMIPLALGVPIGLAAAGAILPALIALVGAALLILLVVGIASVATSVLHLIARDRRRGELIALIFIIVIPVVAMMPGLLGSGGKRHSLGEPRVPSAPTWISRAAGRAAAFYPTEMFVAATREAAARDYGRSATALGGLAVTTLVIHSLGLALFRRVLDSPGSSGARRSVSTRAVWGRRLPGLSSGASAVALAHMRLALRTPRGRSILLSPIAMLVIFGITIYRGSGTMDFGPLQLPGGLALATFASFICLLAILPIAMNQFAVDKAGLTMTLLSPLTDRELLAGKAAGNALIGAPPALFSLAASLMLFPGGSPYLWMALLLALPSVYFLIAPAAAVLSAVFPRVVDMNSIGRGSNAHGAAGLLGMLTFAAAGVPPLALALLATRLFDRPALAPLFLLVWCVVAYAIGRALFIPARRIFAARRENLATLL